MTDTEKIVDRLAKLKRQAESAQQIGSENEAQAFADMLQKLLLDNKLSMTDLEFAQFEKEQPVGLHHIDYTAYPEFEVKRKRIEWTELLASVIAHAHFCRIVVWSNSNKIALIGRKDDAAVAEYMIMTLQRAAERLSEAAYAKYTVECVNECMRCGGPKRDHFGAHTMHKEGTCRGTGRQFIPNWAKARGFKQSYLRSFIGRLFERFREAQRAREANSTALVRINTAKAAVESFMEENYGEKKTAKALSRAVRFNREGVKRGKQAADEIDLAAKAMGAASANGAKLLS